MDREPRIESQIPIPPPNRPTSGAKGKYGPIRRALNKLYVGQSFTFTEEEFLKVRGAIARIQREGLNKHFTIRNLGDGLYRVWRIKK